MMVFAIKMFTRLNDIRILHVVLRLFSRKLNDVSDFATYGIIDSSKYII